MRLIADALRTGNVHLSLRSRGPADALEEILRDLRSDDRVRDWERLHDSLVANTASDVLRGIPSAMFLHHSRTSSVTDLVLAAGRHPEGLDLPGEAGLAAPVRLVFVAAIPEALNSEYLRALGGIARICGDPGSLGELLAADSPETFVSVLERGCGS